MGRNNWVLILEFKEYNSEYDRSLVEGSGEVNKAKNSLINFKFQ